MHDARPFPRLLALSDTTQATPEQIVERFFELARAARIGSIALELRDRALPARQRLALGAELRQIADDTGQLLAVNDRLDLAVLLEAELLHLAEGSVATADARRVVGPDVLVMRACHDVERIGEVDADAVVLGPVMAARKGRPALGLFGVSRARERLVMAGREPRIYALGGVTAETAEACLRAGAFGVAVIGAVLDSPDPRPLLRALDILREPPS